MRTLNFQYDNKPYKLGYSRESVRQLEAQGFSMEKLTEMPMNMIPLLFYGAFALHHRGIKRKLVDEIYDSMADKNGLLRALTELYAETYEDLVGEDTENATTTWELGE